MKNKYVVGAFDTRPWGKWMVLDSGCDAGENANAWVVKRITVNAGGCLSLQRHKHRCEHWIIVAGIGTVTIDNDTVFATPNQSVYIPAGAWHRIENKDTSGELVFIEVQTGEILDEGDIERREDRYGRS
jgi:mannose-1-phosphate guanylyltransferase/mannose-1-phosphate guanylyltransferase/mannose-6-phosphate isomerase